LNLQPIFEICGGDLFHGSMKILKWNEQRKQNRMKRIADLRDLKGLI